VSGTQLWRPHALRLRATGRRRTARVEADNLDLDGCCYWIATRPALHPHGTEEHASAVQGEREVAVDLAPVGVAVAAELVAETWMERSARRYASVHSHPAFLPLLRADDACACALRPSCHGVLACASFPCGGASCASFPCGGASCASFPCGGASCASSAPRMRSSRTTRTSS
jgi:hypothetical protein